jgi:hypothetical protein
MPDSWNALIPAELAPGKYLMRYEAIALQNALRPPPDGVQFYVRSVGLSRLYIPQAMQMSCTQIDLASDGTSKPPKDALVAIPGVYAAADLGITVRT